MYDLVNVLFFSLWHRFLFVSDDLKYMNFTDLGIELRPLNNQRLYPFFNNQWYMLQAFIFDFKLF